MSMRNEWGELTIAEDIEMPVIKSRGETMKPLGQIIADTLRERYDSTGYDDAGTDRSLCAHCTDKWADNVAREVEDLLIDLPGVGKLLASIDRIAR